jgi:hypothetical protein
MAVITPYSGIDRLFLTPIAAFRIMRTALKTVLFALLLSLQEHTRFRKFCEGRSSLRPFLKHTLEPDFANIALQPLRQYCYSNIVTPEL